MTTASPAHLPSSIWTCTICLRDMHIGSSETHLAGKSHREAVRRAHDSEETNLPQASARSTRTWRCTVCQRQMKAKDKEAHLAGRLHKEAVAGSRAGGSAGGGKKADGKSQAGETTSKSSRTERNDDGDDSDSSYSFSREDGLSLLHEIDTGFGCRPGGGAYKESNFYYDTHPDGFDYY